MIEDIRQLETALAAWHGRRYAGRPIDIMRTLAKATEELGEVAKGMLRGDIDNAREECADVMFTLVHLCRMMGGSLFDEAVKKFGVLEERMRTGKKEMSPQRFSSEQLQALRDGQTVADVLGMN